MNEIVNKFLLAGNKFMPEMHLKQPGFLIVPVGYLLKTKKGFQNLKKQEIQVIFTKACFQHNMDYGDFNDLKRRAASDKVLRDKAFDIAKNPKYDGYQRGLASIVYNFFDKKSKGSGVNIDMMHNEQLAEELHKPIIRNFKKRTVYFGSKDNISGADLADMQLIGKFNKGFRFLLLFFSKYAWVVPLTKKC